MRGVEWKGQLGKKELGMPKKNLKIDITFNDMCEFIMMALDGTTLV